MAKEIVAPAVVDSITTITAAIEEEMEMHECPIKVVMQINVAVDEILSNIAYYAYDGKEGEMSVTIDFLTDPSAIKLTFKDSGKPYDPLKKEDPDISLSVDEKSIGGLGIFIVKKTMDKVEYSYENGQNILTIIKKY